jgi:hypothetical protein
MSWELICRAIHHLKDTAYLAGENCRHIARNEKVKVFRFVFNKLKQSCLPIFNHCASRLLDRTSPARDVERRRLPGFCKMATEPVGLVSRRDWRLGDCEPSVSGRRWFVMLMAMRGAFAMRIVYFHSDTHPHDKAIYPGVGPDFAKPLAWESRPISQIGQGNFDLAVVDNRLEAGDVECLKRHLALPSNRRSALFFRGHADPRGAGCGISSRYPRTQVAAKDCQGFHGTGKAHRDRMTSANLRLPEGSPNNALRSAAIEPVVDALWIRPAPGNLHAACLT